MMHQSTFENSAEMLPLTQPGYNYLECTLPFCFNGKCSSFEDGKRYCLTVVLDQTDRRELSDVCIDYYESVTPMERYEDTREQARQAAKAPSRDRRAGRRQRDSTAPSVEGITPKGGSPKGNNILTIYGQNLASKKIDLAGSQSESENEGEDYQIWFQREDGEDFFKIPCTVDRMLTLHAEPLNGKDFVVCETQEVPRFARYWLKMKIDGGDELSGGHYDFYESNAPTAEYFYPANSAAAVASGQYDYEGEFYTRWFDTDDNEDGIEDESFMRHWQEDRAAFQECQNPIGIEVENTDNLRPYENSANENADGKPQADYIDAIQDR